MTDDRTVWYRKWRPQTFAEVAGQEHVTRTLRNAVASGRIAHAYLLCGPRGTGKTTTARLLAKAVNCANPQDGEPCDRCESCVAVREGRALDLVEMDAASNRGIDDIRDLRDRVGYAASGGRYKVYLIDEVHELTQQAFDALLKTLEEPPPHVIFVLATTDAHRVPATIVSRCQRFDLARARPADIVSRLRTIAQAEGVSVDDDALALIGRAATGSFRDAVSLLDQLVASGGDRISVAQAREGLGLTGDARALELAAMAVRGDLPGGLAVIAGVRDDGVDLRQFTREVTAQLRALLLLLAGVEDAVDVEPDALARLRELAAEADVRTVTRALQSFASADFRSDPQASLPVELALVEVALAPAEPVAAGQSFAEVAQARRAAPQAPATPPTAASAAAPNAPAASAKTPAAPAAPAAVEPTSSGAGTARMEPANGSGPPPPPAASPADILRERLARGRDERAPSPPVRMERETEPWPGDPAPVPPPAPPPASPRVNAVEEDALVAPPAVAAAPSGGSASLEQARAQFRQLYERLGQVNRLFAARLNGGDIVAVDGDSVTFGLPHTVQVEKLAAGTPAYKALGDVVAEVFGRRLAVHCVHAPDVEDRLKAQPTRPSHLLDEALKLGAQPIQGL